MSQTVSGEKTEKKNFDFQAEISRLIHTLINSVYSNPDVFLRELIANAADACDRLRYLAISRPELLEGKSDFSVRITADEQNSCLIICDNGVGMSRQEMIDNLGTLARSGTSTFLDKAKEDKGDLQMIGQFGLGFYSSFIVASKVVVCSRAAGTQTSWIWESSAVDGFIVRPAQDNEAEALDSQRGTTVTLYLKPEHKEFVETFRLESVVKRYCEHLPIQVAIMEQGKPRIINSAKAFWERPKTEISHKEYASFYQMNAHGFDEPWITIHAKIEGRTEFTALLFVPGERPIGLMDPDYQGGVKLYVHRVFVREAGDLLPVWLRFVRGIVDSPDIPLNISREMVQTDPAITRIRNALTKRILTALEEKAKKNPEEYARFMTNFGAIFKMGIYDDPANSEKILALSAFKTTKTTGEQRRFLAQYVADMRDGQEEEIYYLTGAARISMEQSPQLEGYKKRGVEVLLLEEPVDDFWVSNIAKYQEKKFCSITKGKAGLEKITVQQQDRDAPKQQTPSHTALSSVVAGIRQALGDKVHDVRLSDRLAQSPCCLVADETGHDMNMQRILSLHQKSQMQPRILEINPDHTLIVMLAGYSDRPGFSDLLTEPAELLFSLAQIAEGEPLPDAADFSQKVVNWVIKGLDDKKPTKAGAKKSTQKTEKKSAQKTEKKSTQKTEKKSTQKTEKKSRKSA